MKGFVKLEKAHKVLFVLLTDSKSWSVLLRSIRMMGGPLLPSSQGILGWVSVTEARCGLKTIMDSGWASFVPRQDLRKIQRMIDG